MKKWCRFTLLGLILILVGVGIYLPIQWYIIYPREGLELDKPVNVLEGDPSEGRYYPQPMRPTELYSINASDCPGESLVTLLTLQGVLAQTKPQIYISKDGSYNQWQTLIEDEGIPILDGGSDPWALVAQFASSISGYIVYRNDTVGAPPGSSVTSGDTLNYEHQDESYCVAVSLSGILNACAVAEQDIALAQAAGLTEIMNVVGKDVEWLFASAYWDQLRHDLIFEVEHHSSRRFFLVDYAVFCGAPVWHAETLDQRAEMLKEFEADSPSFGWGGVADLVLDEGKLNTQTSVAGAFHIPSDWCLDLSVFSAIPANCSQKEFTPIVAEEDVHYVTIIMSDGDNLQWFMNDFGADRWFGNDHLGDFGMGWMMPPAMADLCPIILQDYYDKATTVDRFVAGNSGHGLIYPERCPWTDVHMERSPGILERADITSMVIQDWGWHEKSFTDAAEISNIQGIFYNDYSLYDLQSGKVKWVNDKPCVSMTYNYWINAGQEATVISNKINQGSTNIYSVEGYSIVVVHAWSHGMDDISNMVSNFDDNVRVVDPDSFISLYSSNVPHIDINTGARFWKWIIGSTLGGAILIIGVLAYLKKKKGYIIPPKKK